jgi:predicted AlkP superfamily pyrophosphatase or phosphodiesterase
MINVEASAALRSAQDADGRILPNYSGYGFAQIIPTIEQLLTGSPTDGLPAAALPAGFRNYETVILILIDALGWRFVEPRLAYYPFLHRFIDEGVLSQLTTMFPSTTAAHVTAIHTGLTPAASGIHEWFLYEPSLNAIIAPLLFAYPTDSERETLLTEGLDPAALFPTRTVYQRMATAGVGSSVLYHRTYAHSSFTQTVCDGADVLAYRTLPEAIINLNRRIDRRSGKQYYFLYIDSIDAVCHTYGPDSPQVEAEIDVTLCTLERWLIPFLRRRRESTLLLVTADHGQIGVNPSSTVFVNERVPALNGAARTGNDGRPLGPAGSPRDLFLYIRDDRLDEMWSNLNAALSGRATVLRTRDVIDQGWFGPIVSSEFLERVGNLLILPHPGTTVWWHDPDRRPPNMRGLHGGLSTDEAVTQIGALAFGEE